jgi:hypothetical protein
MICMSRRRYPNVQQKNNSLVCEIFLEDRVTCVQVTAVYYGRGKLSLCFSTNGT